MFDKKKISRRRFNTLFFISGATGVMLGLGVLFLYTGFFKINPLLSIVIALLVSFWFGGAELETMLYKYEVEKK